MKYRINYFLVVCLFSGLGLNAQRMKASVRPGSAPNRVIVTLQPDFNFNQKLQEFGFVFMIPKQSPPGTPIPVPVLSFPNCASCLGSTFAPASWVQVSDNSDPNFYFIKAGCLSNLALAPTLVINTGVQQDAVEVQFNGSTTVPTGIRLAHIAMGGPATVYGFIITDGLGNDLTNYQQMFYGGGVVPAAPHPSEGVGYDNTQFVPIANIVLPITWLTFDAVKQGNDGLLNWSVSNEERNDHFSIERSINGIDYQTIGRVNKTGSGMGVKNYTYTDAGINALGTDVIYYRIGQTDIDGRTSISEVKSIKMGKNNGVISVFPNPAVKGFYVKVPLDNPGNKMVKLNLISSTGQLVQSRSISAVEAANYYFDLNSAMAAGQYQLQVVVDGQVIKSVKLSINKE